MDSTNEQNRNETNIEKMSAPDGSTPAKPGGAPAGESWPGERRMEAEIKKAVDAVYEACQAWGDARDKLRSLMPDDEGHTSALAALIRAKAAVGGAMAASRAVAAMYDEEMAKAQGKADSEASERVEKARKDALLAMVTYGSTAIDIGPGQSLNMKPAIVPPPASEGEPPLDTQDFGRIVHLPDGRQGVITQVVPKGEVRGGHVLEARWWVTLHTPTLNIGETLYQGDYELREDGAYWPKHSASEETGEPKVPDVE
jgi:hypothetical protein